ncbi:MAG: glycosyltransferase [Lacunisphaera sp.]|nr:glycosyltransferase [Lacunisphaera sp.]
MLLFDATHTSHTRAQTGIQRVTRSLFAELAKLSPATAVCHDPYLGAWRALDAGELDHLRPGQTATRSRGAKWPLHKRLAGHARRLAGTKSALPAADGLVCPELFSAQLGAHLPEILGAVRGPRVAIFHDAIGLKLPELTPPGTVARLPGYLRELLLFDGVAAVSADSAASLRDYWQWLGLTETPPVQAIPNGVDPVPAAATEAAPATPRVLCVGTIEGRKNHLALLEACAALWAEGLRFELQLLGLARADTAGRALAKIAALQRAGHPLLYHGAAADAELHAAYRRCTFTVYPSFTEGFGLPVLESLQHGKPCVCSALGALGESARGGGCVALASVDAANLAAALRRLLQNPVELAALGVAARARAFRSWADCAQELTTWMRTLPRRG